MLPELLSLPPAELARRLATVAVEARARKAAAAKQAEGPLDQVVAQAKNLWSAAQPALNSYGANLKSLNVGNPAVAATLGAAALGGSSAIGEAFRPKERRRWGNVALNTALGGLLGGAAPTAVAGLREYLTPGPTIPDAQKSGPQALAEKGLGAIADAGQFATGLANTAKDKLTSATNTNHDAARGALGLAARGGEFVRDNPATTAGGALTLAAGKGQLDYQRMSAMNRGLLGTEGATIQEKLERMIPDTMPDHLRARGDLGAWQRQSAAARAWQSGRVQSRGYGAVPASVFKDLHTQGGGFGGLLTKRLPRTLMNTLPLAGGALIDYLSQANE